MHHIDPLVDADQLRLVGVLETASVLPCTRCCLSPPLDLRVLWDCDVDLLGDREDADAVLPAALCDAPSAGCMQLLQPALLLSGTPWAVLLVTGDEAAAGQLLVH